MRDSNILDIARMYRLNGLLIHSSLGIQLVG